MNKGFTLIELMITVLIVGILASVALPQYTRALERSRAAEPKVIWDTISKMANMAFLEKLLDGDKGLCDKWYLQAGLPDSAAGGQVFNSKHFEYSNENCEHGNVQMAALRKNGDAVLYTLRFELAKDPSTLELITTKTCENGTMANACATLFIDFETEDGESE